MRYLFHCKTLLLTDSFIAVHKAAVEAIRYKKLPLELQGSVLSALSVLCRAYTDGDDDRFLSECLYEFARRARQSGIDDSRLAPFILKTAMKMKSAEAIEMVARMHLRLVFEHPLYADLMARLLREPKVFEHREDELVRLVSSLPAKSRPILAEGIADASVAAYKSHHGMLAFELLELLCAWGEFAAARKAIAALMALLPATIEHESARMAMSLREIAVAIEEACLQGHDESALKLAVVWKATEAKIEHDEK